MRITLTLDVDVARALEGRLADGKATLKQLVNDALRIGLAQMGAPAPARPKFRTKVASLGGCKLHGIDDVSEALAAAEGDELR